MTPPSYTLVIRALNHRIPVEQRLKSILKKMLRHHRFICTSIKPLNQTKDQNQ